jgi:hypothetical protein
MQLCVAEETLEVLKMHASRHAARVCHYGKGESGQ